MTRTTLATKISVPAGTTSNPVFITDINATVTVIPGGGGSMSVEYSTSPTDLINNTATWATWPAGTVTVRTDDSLVGRISAVRAIATTAAGTLEVSQ